MNCLELQTNIAIDLEVYCAICGESLDVNITVDHENQKIQVLVIPDHPCLKEE